MSVYIGTDGIEVNTNLGPALEIYTRWGSTVKIIQYCGKHKIFDFPAPMILVKVRRLEDGKEMYQFAHTLKAEGGIATIDAAIDAAEEVTLKGRALKDALKDAE